MQLDLARPAKDTETKPANHLIKSVRASGESAIGTASHFRSRFDEQSATRGRPTLCLAAARSRVPSPRGSVRKRRSAEGQLRESQLNTLSFRYWSISDRFSARSARKTGSRKQWALSTRCRLWRPAASES